MDTDRYDKLVRFAVIVDAVSLIVFIASKLFTADPSGFILTDSYLSTLKFNTIMTYEGSGMLYLFLFMLAATIVIIVGGQFNVTNMVYCGVALAIVGFVFLCIPMYHTPSVIFNKPVAEEVTVVDKDSSYRGAKIRRWHYTLKFSNSTSKEVSEGVYNNTKAGDRYYVVMCGKKSIGSYSASEYRLP